MSISSIAGSSALGRGNFVYSVTKAGIIQLTRELAVEWAPHRIRVNAIQPAQVMTQAMDRMLADPRLDPGDAQGALPARHSRSTGSASRRTSRRPRSSSPPTRRRFVTGHSLPVDGGNLALNAGGSKVWPEDLTRRRAERTRWPR